MSGREILVSVFLALGAAACVSAHPGYSDIGDYTETPLEYHLHASGRAGEVTQDDHYFVFRAGLADLYDIALADLAIGRATSPDVKQFAARRRADAVADHQRLSVIAEQYIGVPAPVLLDRDRALARDQIATLGGAAFEEAYIRHALRRDDSAIALYTQEARFGGQPILMRFAADGVPRFVQERETAKAVEATLGR
ncbi:MAG TPA: DUF4142 domain-containing protein [Stellaceae bacterium]|nr:DUF4142 domain-containing protein [Stellaceae bacterium]